MRSVQREIDRLAQFQIDSISVVTRAHQFPLFTRLGVYDVDLLRRAAGRAPRRLFEYWGHAASLIDVQLYPALQFKMREARQTAWRSMVRILEQSPELVDRVLAEVAERGPISSRDIEHDEVRNRDEWGWNWSSAKTALEWHFWSGSITAADRNAAFERRYDLPSRVLPPDVLAQPELSRDEAHVVLARRAALALGVFSTRCVADYFRTDVAATKQALRVLEDAGEIVPVDVEGWRGPTWLWHDARVPRSINARALVSPFDSLIFERRRAQALFELDYRIEIYVPEAQRRHGYYVYPFLLGERFAARVDMKAERANGVLRVKAAWLEPGHPSPIEVICAELAAELRLLATWLGLSDIVVDDKGDLATALAAAVRE